MFLIAGEEKQALKIGGDDIVDRIPDGKVSVTEKAETNLAAGDGSRGKLICTRFNVCPQPQFCDHFYDFCQYEKKTYSDEN